MKIILKDDVENLGRKGDIVEVSRGYGRNYLIPKRLAIEVTSSNVKMIQIEQQAIRKKVEQERLSSQELIQKLSEVNLTFKRKAGEKDVIFGSVGSSDIKEALDKRGFNFEKKKILLSEPIKRLGNFTVPIKVYQDNQAEIKIEVIKEGEEKGEEVVKEREEVKEEGVGEKEAEERLGAEEKPEGEKKRGKAGRTKVASKEKKKKEEKG